MIVNIIEKKNIYTAHTSFNERIHSYIEPRPV